MATTKYTNSVTLSDAGAFNDYDIASYSNLTSVAGTNTITATGPASLTAYAAGQRFRFIPANTNTGATTIAITGDSALAARNIFWNGAACIGGELRANIPTVIHDDGTRFHIVSSGFNLAYLDTHAVVEGSADSTKKIRFEVDGLTTATTRVITPLDADFTMARQDAAQTFTGVQTINSLNKWALTAPTTAATLTAGADNLTYTMPIVTGLIPSEQLQQNSKSAAYTTVLADANKHIIHPTADTTARTFTIDSNANVAYTVGTAITFVNQISAGVLTIAITSDTMYLSGGTSTGSRTLTAVGVATALKVTSTQWIISGSNLT